LPQQPAPPAQRGTFRQVLAIANATVDDVYVDDVNPPQS
jgi:hypothetical protein